MIFTETIKAGDFVSFKEVSIELRLNPNLQTGKLYKVSSVKYVDRNRFVYLKLDGVVFIGNGKFFNPVFFNSEGKKCLYSNSTIILEKSCSSFIQEELEI